MDVPWIDRLSLFRYAILAALSAGLVCPLIGALLLVRRTSFYGITLPQFASAGVVFGFVVLPWWIAHVGLGGIGTEEALASPHAAMNYTLAWAAAFTFGGLLALAIVGRKPGSEVGRLAAAFAIANASIYVFGRVAPVGKGFVDELFSGEILGVGVHELETLSVVLAFVMAALVVFHRDFLVVSYDRETAVVLKKRVLSFEVLLNVLTGLTAAVGTMTVGPTLLFGLLVLPPLGARRFARSMPSFYWLSSAFGVASVVGGVVLSFELDLPMGAAIVATAALLLVPGSIAGRFARR